MTSRNKILFYGLLTVVAYLVISFLIISSSAGQSSQPSQWNIVTLKEYIDLRFESASEAVKKAELASERRFESVNEFRAQLSDQQRTFIPRDEYEAAHIELSRRVDELRSKIDKIENMKQGGNVVWAYVVAAISLLVAVVGFSKKYSVRP